MRDMESLPPELLDQIFHRLHQHDLCNVSLTCKRLYDSAATALYHTSRCQKLGDNGSQASLLHTITTKPQLAKRVRNLRFNYPCTRHASVSGDVSSNPHWSNNITAELTTRYSETGSGGFVAELLLHYAGHLESLMLGNNHVFSVIDRSDAGRERINEFCSIFWAFVEQAASLTPRLDGSRPIERLHTVILYNPLREASYCRQDASPHAWSSQKISFFFRIETLKTFIAEGLDEMSPITSSWLTQPRVSNITTLRLWHCNVSLRCICHLLRSCKTLETFDWVSECDKKHQRDGPDPDASFLPELLYFAPSLKWLGLHTDCTGSWNHPVVACLGNWQLLWTILPALPNLESLTMDQSALAMLESFPTCLQKMPPNLQRLTYTFDASDHRDPPERLIESTIDVCQAIPRVELNILTGFIADQLWLGKWRTQYPDLSFDFHYMREPLSPDPMIPMGALEIRRQARIDETPSHIAYMRSIRSAYAPYSDGKLRIRPWECSWDHRRACKCGRWPTTALDENGDGILQDDDEEDLESGEEMEED